MAEQCDYDIYQLDSRIQDASGVRWMELTIIIIYLEPTF